MNTEDVKISQEEAIEKLHEALKSEHADELSATLDMFFPEDIAEALGELTTPDGVRVLQTLVPDTAVDVIRALEPDDAMRILTAFPPELLASSYLNIMDSDDAADLLNLLPINVSEELLNHLPDREQATNIVSLLRYEEHTAGALMGKELVKVQIDWNLAQCVDEIRKQAENVEKVYTVYVVDKTESLVGLVSLKSIILNNASTRVKDIYNEDILWVNAYTPAVEVAQNMQKYGLVVMPVVDALHRLVGRITIDDVVDYIKEEADRDFQMMSGLAGEVEISDRVWVISRARLPWLIIGLLGGIVSSRMVGVFEGDLLIHPQMAFFMPLVAAMGGNAGVQASALIVQGLANKSLEGVNFATKLLKEFMVSALNGLILGAIILAYNLLVLNNVALGLTVSVALFSVLIFASILGMIVPLLLDRAKVDPALATGPFITTMNDILGITLYFGMGRLLL